jgi:hypothetical protein
MGSNGLSVVDGYPAQNIVRVVPFNGNGDSFDDVAVLYDYGLQATGRYRSAIHVWKSNGSTLAYQGPSGWWLVDGYNAREVKWMLPGYFDQGSNEDISLVFKYGPREARLHMLLSVGTSLAYQGSTGWWSSTDFPIDSIAFMVSGNFNEQPSIAAAKIAADADSTALTDTLQQADLMQNYPNPFNPVTVIEYSLPEATHVSLKILNVLGQTVTELVNADQAAGVYAIPWDATPYATGVYFYRLQAGEQTKTKKMLLIK